MHLRKRRGMKLKYWELSLIVAIIVTLFVTTGAAKSQKVLSDKLVRLHVVANSDTEADQALKLKVRDAVLSTLEEPLRGITDAKTAQSVITDNFDTIESAATDIIQAAGYDYGVTVCLGIEDFPTREYDTFSLPAGQYNALRVVIGDGVGKNWWCVVFPPLCTELAETAEAVALLDEEEIKLITEQEGYVVRFKCIELLAAVKEWFSK